jgi:hypothetical protein
MKSNPFLATKENRSQVPPVSPEDATKVILKGSQYRVTGREGSRLILWGGGGAISMTVDDLKAAGAVFHDSKERREG